MAFPLAFASFEAVPLSREPAKILIRWELKSNSADLSDYEFYIDRGDAPDQIPGFQSVDIDGKPLKGVTTSTGSINQRQISPAISAADFYQWVDRTPELRNLDKVYSYKIRLRRISTQEEISTPSFNWVGDLDLIGMYIVEEHNFLLEDVTGVPCLVFVRRKNGIYCPACFDPIQKKRTSSSCLTCYNTNYVGGFHNPIDTYIDVSPDPTDINLADWGEVQKNETDLLMSNYPEVVPGDLIKELRSGRLWRVAAARPTEKRRASMLQLVRVMEVSAGDIEYKMPIDQELILKKVREFEAIRSRREF